MIRCCLSHFHYTNVKTKKGTKQSDVNEVSNQCTSLCDQRLSVYHTENHLLCTKTLPVRYLLPVKRLKKTQRKRKRTQHAMKLPILLSKWTEAFSSTVKCLSVFFTVGYSMLGKHCLSVTVTHASVALLRVVLSCVTAPQNSISLGRQQNLQSLLINNSYPPFIAADTLILAAMMADNYLVCVIMSLPDEMKRTQRVSVKPSAAWITAGFSHCVGNHQLHESIRNSPAFFFFFYC